MAKQKLQIGDDGIYDARKLGAGRMLVLGVQHMFAMFGATVLVPLLTGLDVATTLLMAGLGTLLFHLITKGKGSRFSRIVICFPRRLFGSCPAARQGRNDSGTAFAVCMSRRCGCRSRLPHSCTSYQACRNEQGNAFLPSGSYRAYYHRNRSRTFGIRR